MVCFFLLQVEHECFGKCVGILLPEAAINAESRCVECLECEGLFSPHKFVCHSHVAENRTCHWGFDSAHWRSYLHLWEGYSEEQRDKLERRFSDFKNRFSANGQMKRKLVSAAAAEWSGSKPKRVSHMTFIELGFWLEIWFLAGIAYTAKNSKNG